MFYERRFTMKNFFDKNKLFIAGALLLGFACWGVSTAVKMIKGGDES
jgi:hypothetical protein